MQNTSPYRSRAVRIFIGAIAVLWIALVGAQVLGHRLLKPNLESGTEQAAYGQSYNHK
ncbi:MAG: hypothetical protein JNM62_04045 [Flavobacteriales bacterium]|nr:hypothetical protein [Flavobacteriales bacterium]